MGLKINNVHVDGFEAALRGLRNPLESHYKADSKFGIGLYDDIVVDEIEVATKWTRALFPELCAETVDINNYTDTYNNHFESMDKWLLDQSILQKENDVVRYAFIGPNDLELARKMVLAGTDEAKFTRMIHVQADIEAPLFWWKEYDTYKIGTVANSESTMHKLLQTPINMENFVWENCDDLRLIDPTGSPNILMEMHVDNCEQIRQLCLSFLEKSKDPYYTKKEQEEFSALSKRYWRALIQMLPDSWIQKRTVDLNYQTLRAMYFARKHHKLVEWKDDFCHLIEELPYSAHLITCKREE